MLGLKRVHMPAYACSQDLLTAAYRLRRGAPSRHEHGQIPADYDRVAQYRTLSCRTSTSLAATKFASHGDYVLGISRAVITPSILRSFSTCASATSPSMSMML